MWNAISLKTKEKIATKQNKVIDEVDLVDSSNQDLSKASTQDEYNRIRGKWCLFVCSTSEKYIYIYKKSFDYYFK